MLLAIDTSLGTSVACVDERGILAERSTADTRSHAEVVGRFIQECLTEANLAATEISGVAIGMGPGPFTGLRVGIAAARAFAFGVGAAVIPVVSHDAIAFGHAEPVVVASDARRRELFSSEYSGSDDDGLPIRSAGPMVIPAATFIAPPGYRLLEPVQVSAGSLGMLAERIRASNRASDLAEPLYLRSPDVTLSAGPKRVTA